MSHKKRTKLYECAPDDQLPLSNPGSGKSRAYVLSPVGFIDLVRRYGEQDHNGRLCRLIREKMIIPQAGRTARVTVSRDDNRSRISIERS